MNIEPLYGKELEKCSYGILQELFMEQNTSSGGKVIKGRKSSLSHSEFIALQSASGHSARPREGLLILSFLPS